jgi:hypothetical protein
MPIFKQNFLGQAGFIWWVGVVEDRKDPLNIGRCQIRIFGWHTDDLKLIPSADLPWAHPVMPINDSRNFNTPKEGDYVVGFFFDGESGQFPGYLGVLPGVPATAAPQQAAAPQKGFQDLRTSAELATAPVPPKKVDAPTDGSGASVTDQPASRNPSSAGFPTVPPIAINDLKNPPEQITKRLENIIKDIPGPDNKNLADAIAGAAQGAQAALGGAAANLQALVPNAAALNANIISTLPITVPKDLSSGFLDSAKQAASQAQAEIKAAQEQLTKTTAAVQKQLAEATAAAQAQAQAAAASASQGLADLQSKAQSVASTISGKLNGLASGSVTTTYPVTLVDGVPNINGAGLTLPLNQVNTMATELQSNIDSLQSQLKTLLSKI